MPEPPAPVLLAETPNNVVQLRREGSALAQAVAVANPHGVGSSPTGAQVELLRQRQFRGYRFGFGPTVFGRPDSSVTAGRSRRGRRLLQPKRTAFDENHQLNGNASVWFANMSIDVFLAATESVRSLIAAPQVAGAWEEPSALAAMTVGGLTAHLVHAVASLDANSDRPVPAVDPIDTVTLRPGPG
jgi:hypothetical protein